MSLDHDSLRAPPRVAPSVHEEETSPGTSRTYTFAAPKSGFLVELVADAPSHSTLGFGVPTTMKSPLTATEVPNQSSLSRSVSDAKILSTTATFSPVQISGIAVCAASAWNTYAAPVWVPFTSAIGAPTITSPALAKFTAR